jgi:hypothetical protein
MATRDAAPEEPLPTEWDLTYEPCPIEGTAQRYHRESKTFFEVPCETSISGSRLCWTCKMGHMHEEFASGRDPIGNGGTPFATSAREGWTQMGALKESTDHARANGVELQRASRS